MGNVSAQTKKGKALNLKSLKPYHSHRVSSACWVLGIVLSLKHLIYPSQQPYDVGVINSTLQMGN